MKKFWGILIVGIILIVSFSFYFVERGYFFIEIKNLLLYTEKFTNEFQGKLKIVKYIRVPRILIGILAGGILSASGAVFQGVLFNPLADSYILGIASGASFGAALAIFFKLDTFGSFTIVIFAFIFAVLSLYLVLYLSKRSEVVNSNTLILSGIIISAFFSAGLSFLQFLKGEEVQSIIFWIMGSFASKTWSDVIILTITAICGMGIFILYSKELNIISLGDRIARTSGVDVKKVKNILLVTASLTSAAVVAVTGVIGFIGLMIPHLVRGLIGSDNKKLIPLTFIYGGLIAMVADNIIRVYFPSEIPVGVLTALFGAPFFIIVFRKKLGGRSK